MNDNYTPSPSALPHLAACRCYRPAAGSSEAARRGTRIDKAIRAAWIAANGGALFGGCFFKEDLPTKDRHAVDWAIKQLELLRDFIGASILVEGDNIQAAPACDGINGGSMDGIAPESGWAVEFKTGKARDYMPQLAAYALACMERYKMPFWNARILFVDLQQKYDYSFTRKRARDIVQNILNKPAIPCPGDHCKYCGAKCHARILSRD